MMKQVFSIYNIVLNFSDPVYIGNGYINILVDDGSSGIFVGIFT